MAIAIGLILLMLCTEAISSSSGRFYKSKQCSGTPDVIQNMDFECITKQAINSRHCTTLCHWDTDGCSGVVFDQSTKQCSICKTQEPGDSIPVSSHDPGQGQGQIYIDIEGFTEYDATSIRMHRFGFKVGSPFLNV